VRHIAVSKEYSAADKFWTLRILFLQLKYVKFSVKLAKLSIGIMQRKKDSVFSTQCSLFVRLFVAICRAYYVDNVEPEALEAVARWSVIGKVVSFKLRLKMSSEWTGLSDRKWYVIPDFRGTVGKVSVAAWHR